LAERYVADTRALQDGWRQQLAATAAPPAADAAAWALIELPGHPVLTLPVMAGSSLVTSTRS